MANTNFLVAWLCGGADMKFWIHSRCFWCMVHMGLISPFDQRFRLYNYTGKLQ